MSFNSISVSVVIPTHNRVDDLSRAIDSVINQTILPQEILVVDDVSDLDTKKLVDRYSHCKVRYILNTIGRGASSSRNLGTREARGNFVAFLDDDDEWLPHKLEEQLNEIKDKPNVDAVFTRILVRYEELGIEYSTNAENRTNIIKSILVENFLGATISAMINRQRLIDLGGFDPNFPAREEYDLWIRLIATGSTISVIEKPLAISYRSFLRGDRISSNINNYILANEMMDKKHDALIHNHLTDNEQRERLDKQFNFIAAQALSIGDRKNSFFYYLRSMIISFSIKKLVLAFMSLVSPRFLILLRSQQKV